MRGGRDLVVVVFFNGAATTEIYTLSLPDALPICLAFSIFGVTDAKNSSWKFE